MIEAAYSFSYWRHKRQADKVAGLLCPRDGTGTDVVLRAVFVKAFDGLEAAGTFAEISEFPRVAILWIQSGSCSGRAVSMARLIEPRHVSDEEPGERELPRNGM